MVVIPMYHVFGTDFVANTRYHIVASIFLINMDMRSCKCILYKHKTKENLIPQYDIVHKWLVTNKFEKKTRAL